MHDTVYPKKLARNRHNAVHVFAMQPFDKETFMNLDLNLSRYLTPRVTAPNTTDTNATAIEMYSSCIWICFFEDDNMNSSAVKGADTLISFDPCAMANIQIETDRGISNSLSIRCSARFSSHFA